jgi:cytosine deaminase
MVAENGARSLHIADYGLRVGNPANLVLLPVKNTFEALRHQVTPTLVISRGKVVARNTPGERVFTGG